MRRIDKSEHSPRNRLIEALPEDVVKRLEPYLEPVSFELGEVLYEAHDELSHVYFPTTCIVSLLSTMKNGSTAEMGVVGRDGMVGIAVFMGGETPPNQAVVQNAGDAARLTLNVFRNEYERVGALHRLLLLYTQALLTQVSQSAACNQLHPIEQRLCRSLLLSCDRLDSNELAVTQELAAKTLGVRREAVSLVAHRLQNAGLIRYKRGHMTIMDREGLEARVCECYRIVRTECERLLPYQARTVISDC